jgi:predicted ester cyclase
MRSTGRKWLKQGVSRKKGLRKNDNDNQSALLQGNSKGRVIGVKLNGPGEFKQFISMLGTAFPDIQYKVEDIVCDGDILAVRTSFTGTMTGPLRGIPPTGKKVAIQEALFYRYEGDKIAEEWSFINQMDLLKQLGIIPPAP